MAADEMKIEEGILQKNVKGIKQLIAPRRN